MSQSNIYIVAYDVASSRRLRQSLKVLSDYAAGRQKSVFECHLDDAGLRELTSRMHEVIDPEADRFLTLRASTARRWRVLGIAPQPQFEDFFLVE